MFVFNGKIAVQCSDEVRREQDHSACLVLLLLVSLSGSGRPIKSFQMHLEKKRKVLLLQMEGGGMEFMFIACLS
jgi:hypothetical protein